MKIFFIFSKKSRNSSSSQKAFLLAEPADKDLKKKNLNGLGSNYWTQVTQLMKINTDRKISLKKNKKKY